MNEIKPSKTPLYDLHLSLGAKMVPFAGYEMPVQYPLGIKQEHLHVRAKAGLFDVSHMGQILLKGAGIDKALEKLIPVDVEALKVNQQSYAVFTNDNGGILDDLIVTRWSEDSLFLIVNAACKAQDLQHLQTHLKDFELTLLETQALLALQGPKAYKLMYEIAPETAALTFMQGCHAQIDGVDCYITRSGYTGEDGFEISLPANSAEAIAKKLLSYDDVEAIGLGARDSLRLEAGLCLYGHDMNTETTPIEANLAWSISKTRRKGAEKAGGFIGAEAIFKHTEDGLKQKRVGFLIEGRAPVREGAEIVDANEKVIGHITSGGFSPSLNACIAMGFVEIAHSQLETPLHAIVRGKARALKVTSLPFVKQNYYRA